MLTRELKGTRSRRDALQKMLQHRVTVDSKDGDEVDGREELATDSRGGAG